MESFWWILVHLCITRAGPGGLRRSIPGDSVLAHVVLRYYDGNPDRIFASKEEVFRIRGTGYEPALGNVENDLFHNFHPYFEPLKGLFLKRWKTLYSAYEFHGYELFNIHHHVLQLLDEVKGDPALSPSTPHDQTVLEEKRQKLYHEEVKNAIVLKRAAPSGFKTASPVAVSQNRTTRTTKSDNDQPSAKRRKTNV
ncbi:hypothetical protein M422DRAFT_266241 [Sphaerobolus stellatus SS14]|nr:hypothetical protein M422DRAFT_266241 [Sphaerobolus stellatus SS14]